MNYTGPDKVAGDPHTHVEFNQMKNAVNSKVDSVTGKGLSTNDYTDAEKSKLGSVANNATNNSPDVFLLARANHTGTQTADTIIDGVTNKVYTATDKTKLGSIATGATVNNTDAFLLARANHTGVQVATTITEDSTHRFTTDAEKTAWNAKATISDINAAITAATLYFSNTDFGGTGTSTDPFTVIGGGGGLTTGTKGDINVVAVNSDWQLVANSVGSNEIAANAVIAAKIAADAVTTVKILDKNITLAKIADFSAANKLLGSNSGGAAAAEIGLGAGFSIVGGNLTYTGGAASIAFQDEGSAIVSASTVNFVGAGVTTTNVGGVATVTIPGGAGGDNQVVLERLNGSGANHYDINLNQYGGTYRHFRVVIHDISGQSTDIHLQTSSDGITFDGGAGNYAYTRTTGAGSTTGSDTKLWLFGLGNASAADAADGYLILNNPLNNTTKNKYLTYFIQGDTYNPGFNIQFGGAKRVSTAILHTLRIYTSNSANFNFSYTLMATKIS